MAFEPYFVLVILLAHFHISQQYESDLVSIEVALFDSASDVRIEKISKKCAELGICELSTNYPKEIAKNLRYKVNDTNVILDKDPVIVQPFKGTVMSASATSDNPCKVSNKRLKPQIARDVNGRWHYALNFDDEAIQQYNVELCKTYNDDKGEDRHCGALVPHNGFSLRCVQKYIVRTIVTVKNNDLIPVPFYIPCCCTCVAIPD